MKTKELERRIRLKVQARRVISRELMEFRDLRNLLRLEAHLHAQMRPGFDPGLSARLDACRYLIEELSPKILTSEGPDGLN